MKVWFVPGTSNGVRLRLIKDLLKEGYKVAVTTDNLNSLTERVGKYDRSQLLPILIKPKDPIYQKQATFDTIRHFGQIDVVVLNPRIWLDKRC